MAGAVPYQARSESESRRSPIVRAVAQARDSVVNIHGEKTVPATDAPAGQGEVAKRVNGMGTGVILDERGYIITNHHVVDGVKKITVTTAEMKAYTARLISHDSATDLAIIKIDVDEKLPVIPIGSSSDLMAGETVIAVGNAYGYEHTVTRGIVSALHRVVQVSDTQDYDDLIQTDASINPGNSGGPLLNIDGDMIGINVAVRAGAQGIGFAIPSDKVLEVASELLCTRRVTGAWHGVVAKPWTAGEIGLVVGDVDRDSPAAETGIQAGDVIVDVAGQPVIRSLDFERALLDYSAGSAIEITVEREHSPLSLNLTLAEAPQAKANRADDAWDALGLELKPLGAKQIQRNKGGYRGGLSVVDVRPDGPAAQQGIRRGDVLVGVHVWETVSLENVRWILRRPEFAKLQPVKFYILRGNETLFGRLSAAPRARK